MNDQKITEVIKKVRAVVYHVGTFESSYPRILKNAPLYTRSHLIVLYEILPYLKHLLNFTAETIPVVTKILGVATEGKSDLEQASDHLRTINQSSESAVTEIFAALDQVGSTLQKAQKSEEAGDELKKTLKVANAQLMGIMNALQFQDITSQKIEATNALLARLGDGLVGLIHELGVEIDKHNIKVREGTYDATATFDREKAETRQDEIDNLITSETTEVAKPAPAVPKQTPAPPKAKSTQRKNAPPPAQNGKQESVGTTDPVSADDLDSLIASTQSETKTDNDPVSADDLDSLIASAQSEVKTDSDPVSADDLDSLIASTQSETKTEPARFNQDDIDALLGDNKK